MGRQLVADLTRQRPDGLGTFIEHPDAASMKRIDRVQRRIVHVDRALNKLEGKEATHKRWVEGDPYGLSRYSDFESPGRRAYEDKLIADRLAGATSTGRAVFLSGGPASGKSTLRQREFGDAKGFVTIDPDELKNADPVMAIGVALGMRAAAALAHENSSRLAKRLYGTTRDQGLDVLVDGTGANAGKYISQMQELQGRGYRVTLLAQHVPEEVGVSRALARADKAGRYVPPEFIRHAYEVIPGNFERLARVADSATLNDGESNTVIMRYERGRHAGGDAKRTAEYRKRYGRPRP